jgi:hypothetical protein
VPVPVPRLAPSQGLVVLVLVQVLVLVLVLGLRQELGLGLRQGLGLGRDPGLEPNHAPVWGRVAIGDEPAFAHRRNCRAVRVCPNRCRSPPR